MSCFCKNIVYIVFIMNENFRIEHWKSEDKPMGEIVDVTGATKILGITRATLWHWESEKVVVGFKYIYKGRLRKCFWVNELEALVRNGKKVAA